MSPTHLEDVVSAYNSIANELQEAYDAYAVALTEFAVEYKKQMDYRPRDRCRGSGRQPNLCRADGHWGVA